MRELFEFLDSETLSEAHGGSTFQNTQNNKGKSKFDREKERSKQIKQMIAKQLISS